MQVAIDSIIVKERVRKDMGDLENLKNSLRTVGQLNPIVITRDNELIAGHRRYLAAKSLGWRTIDAVSVDRATEVDKLQMELEENVVRKEFTTEEVLEGYRKLEELRHPRFRRGIGAAFRKLGSFIGSLFRGRKKNRKFPTRSASHSTQPRYETLVPDKEPETTVEQDAPAAASSSAMHNPQAATWRQSRFAP